MASDEWRETTVGEWQAGLRRVARHGGQAARVTIQKIQIGHYQQIFFLDRAIAVADSY